MAVEIPRDLADPERGVTLRNGASVRVRAIRPDDEPRLMALCRRLSPRTTNEGTTADIGLVVADGWQGLGLGSLLLEEILRAGEQRGVHQFSADVLTENRRALRLLARHTAITRRTVPAASPASCSVAVPTPPSRPRDTEAPSMRLAVLGSGGIPRLATAAHSRV